MTKKQVLALIPARSGSKGIPDKNIATFGGKPMLAHSIEHALQAPSVTRTVVSTDSEVYANIARQWGAECPFLRPAEISGDLSTDLEAIQHALKWLDEHEGYRPQICVHLRPTYPRRRVEDIERCIARLLDDPTLDSVRTVTPASETPYKMWLTREDGTLEPVATCDVAEAYNQPRQRLPQAYIQNANVDVFWTRVVHERGSQTGSRIGAVVEQDIHDIDTTNELRAAARGRPKELHGKVFVVDIDGVLATITPQNDYNVAEPIRANIEAINRLYEMGNRILLFTARGSMTGIDWAEATRRQMDTWGVKYHDLRLGKPAADYYIDDRLWAIEEVVEWVMGTSNAPAERKS